MPGWESTEAVGQPMVGALADLLAEVPPGRVGVAVTSGAAARVAVAARLGRGLSSARDLGALGSGARLVLTESAAGCARAVRMRLAAYDLSAGA